VTAPLLGFAAACAAGLAIAAVVVFVGVVRSALH